MKSNVAGTVKREYRCMRMIAGAIDFSKINRARTRRCRLRERFSNFAVTATKIAQKAHISL